MKQTDCSGNGQPHCGGAQESTPVLIDHFGVVRGEHVILPGFSAFATDVNWARPSCA